METYIEKEFLDDFFINYDSSIDSHIDLKRLFGKKTLGKIIFNLKDENELRQVIEENPIFDLLIDGRGYNHIDFKPDFKKEAQSKSFYNNNSNPTKVFFLNKGNQTIENDFAQLVFHNNNISDLLPFITAKPKSINKRDDGCWDFLDSIKHPCNSLVILDDYILTDSNELIEENLIELLKKIMPLKLNQNLEFQITIIGENQGVKLIDKKNKILKKLNNFYSYPINLSIIPEKIHDRRIFTNYYWIISGYGFTLFQDKKVKKETSFTFIPIFCETNERVKELAKCFPIQKNGKFGEVGERKNRLLQ
jgi:hypothetical protein